MQARSILVASFAAVAVLAAPAHARADIAPPQRSACHDKKIGAACSFGSERGTCTARLCTDRAGEPWDCVLCVGAGTDERPPHVEPPPSFAPPLFDAGARRAPPRPSRVATQPGSPPPVPAPVAGGGCGRCATATRASDGRQLLTLALVAAIVVARRASRTRTS